MVKKQNCVIWIQTVHCIHQNRWHLQRYCRRFWNYNQFHNTLRLFDVLPDFPFTTNETMCDYYLEIWYIRVALWVAERRKTLGNIRKLPKLQRMIA